MSKNLLGGIACLFFMNCQASCFSFSEATDFYNAIPVGWSVDNTYAHRDRPYLDTRQPASVGGTNAMCIVFNSAYAGATMFLTKTNAINDIAVCDNFVFSVTVYVEPKGSNVSAVDSVQPVISIDGGAFVELGHPVPLKNESIEKPSWMTYTFPTNIQDAANKEIKVGLEMIAGGYSSSRGYVKSIDVGFKVCALVESVDLIADGKEWNSDSLCPVMSNLQVRAKIDVSPDDESKLHIIENEVLAEISANSINMQARLTKIGEYWYSDVLPYMDAGTFGKISVIVPYTSPSGIDTLDQTNGYGIAAASLEKELVVNKLGSIWLNEITTNAIEICGTTNRVYTGGWCVSISNNSENAHSDLNYLPCQDFNIEFTNTIYKTRGVVGIAYFTGIDFSTVAYPATVRLLNSSGIVEDEVVLVERPISSWSRVNCAIWNDEYKFSYDWTGTATNGVFDWINTAEASIGDVNPEQGFRTEEDKVIEVYALIGTNEVALPYANVVVAVDDFLNSTTAETFTKSKLADSNGVALCELSGWTPNLSNLFAKVHASAFGWQSPIEEIAIPRTDETNGFSIVLTPSTATDDFQSELLASWVNEGVMYDSAGKRIYWAIKSDNILGKYLCLYTARAYGTGNTQTLRCSNYLSANGKYWLNISFDTKNMGSNAAQGRKDTLTFEFGTNTTWTGETVVTSPITDKNPNFPDGNWYGWANQIKLPDEFAAAPELYMRLIGSSEGATSSELAVRNLRIAFQDMATITNLVRTGTEANPGFDIEVEPWCGEGQSVSNVAVQLVMDVNGTLFTNYAFANGAITNNLSLVTTFTVSPEVISAGLMANLGQAQLRVGDTVRYWAQVNYYADSRDPDPAKEWETRYFPDNSNVDSEGRWTVEGEYGVNTNAVANSYSYVISGNPISMNGDFVITNADVTTVRFNFRAYDAAGVSNVTATISAAGLSDQVYSFVTNGVVRYDNEVSASGLAPNTEYTVTITAMDVNSNALTPATFTFTTLPEAPTAEIRGISTNEVEVTVSGDAAGYVVPAGWTQTSANTWTKSGLTPNVVVTAEGVYATNKVGGASATIDATPGHTLAAVATKAPVIEKLVTTVAVKASDDYSGDGNPEGTEYAIRVTTSAGGNAIVSTNNVEVWKTLDAWKSVEPLEVAIPQIDLAATNYFSFVTRNFDGDETPNGNPVTTNCWFEMTVGFAGVPAQMAAASAYDPSFGKVAFSLEFFDPMQSNATAEVEYSLDDGAAWTRFDSVDVPLADLGTTGFTTNLTWNAREAVVGNVETNYQLRVKLTAGNRESDWSVSSGTLDFVPPTGLAISGTLANGTTTASTSYSFTFAAADNMHDVTYGWTLDGASGTGATKSGTVAAGYASHTLTVVATDAMGNASDPVTLSWTVDTLSPEWSDPALSGDPEEGVVTNSTAFSFTAFATDNTALSYHWALNGMNVTGVTGTTFVDASPSVVAAEGTNTVSVYATDLVGNVSTTTSRTWVVDTIAPTKPTITPTTGEVTDGGITSVPKFTMVAAADDATALTYHWKLNNDPESIGAEFAGTASERGNVVSVYAVDEAGNVSPTNIWNWTLDTTPPTVISITSTSPNPFNTDTMTVTVEFSEIVAGFTTGSVTVDNGTVGNVAGSGAVYTFEVTPTDDGMVTVQIPADAVTDLAGNGNVASETPLTRRYDATKPTVTGLSTDTPEFFNSSPMTVTVTFSEIVTGFTTESVTVDNGTPTAVSPAGVATNVYVVTVEPEADGEVSVQIESGKVTDLAGNENEASGVLTRTYDTTAPEPPEIGGTPASGATTSDTGVALTAFSTDIGGSGVDRYMWRLNNGGFTEAQQTCPLGWTANEGPNTVYVYAIDRAGNASATNMLCWTVDTIAPTNLQFTVAPAEGACTNVAEFAVTVTSDPDATAISYHWSLNGVEIDGNTSSNCTGTATENSTNTVSVYATDTAGNRSETISRIWVVDTLAPTTPVISGTPAQFTNVPEFSMTAESTDATRLTYHWTLNNVEASEDSATFAGTVSEGEYTVSVYAEDEAGNVSPPATCSWTYDITPPTEPRFTAKPDEFTNKKEYSFAVESTDAVSGVEQYFWSLNDGAFVAGETTLTRNAEEGVTNTVRVYSVDGAGNSSATNSWSWTYDATKPTVVELSTGTPEYFNEALSPMTVTVSFSETVTNFTAASVYVTNAANVVVSPSDMATNIYTVTITPFGDGEVSVQIPAGVVADYAGNGNEVSGVLTRIYDIRPPTVTLTSETPEPPALLNLAAMPFAVKVTFSEPVTNFTKESVTVVDGIVTEFVNEDNSYTNYTVKIEHSSTNVTEISVQLAAGVVHDRAGNPNEASNVLTRNCDVSRPIIIIDPRSIHTNQAQSVDLTIQFSESVTNDNFISVEEAIKTLSTVSNGTVGGVVSRPNHMYRVEITPWEGVTNVTFQIKEGVVTDLAGNDNVAMAKYIFTWDGSANKWSYVKEEEEEEPTAGDVEFGGGVCVKVENGVTNAVCFTSIDFRPGDTNTFTMSRFDASTQSMPDFNMWFVVCETLGGPTRHVKVDAATFNSATHELTVTLPAGALEKNGGGTCSSFFILGVDNKDPNLGE